jgi:hypothetical protein
MITGFMLLSIETVAASYKPGNEKSNSLKAGQFLGQMNNYQCLKELTGVMELTIQKR